MLYGSYTDPASSVQPELGQSCDAIWQLHRPSQQCAAWAGAVVWCYLTATQTQLAVCSLSWDSRVMLYDSYTDPASSVQPELGQSCDAIWQLHRPSQQCAAWAGAVVWCYMTATQTQPAVCSLSWGSRVMLYDSYTDPASSVQPELGQSCDAIWQLHRPSQQCAAWAGAVVWCYMTATQTQLALCSLSWGSRVMLYDSYTDPASSVQPELGQSCDAIWQLHRPSQQCAAWAGAVVWCYMTATQTQPAVCSLSWGSRVMLYDSYTDPKPKRITFTAPESRFNSSCL